MNSNALIMNNSYAFKPTVSHCDKAVRAGEKVQLHKRIETYVVIIYVMVLYIKSYSVIMHTTICCYHLCNGIIH